jgi:uncharacterized FlaG/YvyC family protein
LGGGGLSISSTTGIVPFSGPAEPAGFSSITQDQRNLIQAVKAIDPIPLFGQNNKLTFVWDRTTNRMLVRVINRKTGDIVNQIPPEYVVRLAEESKGR